MCRGTCAMLCGLCVALFVDTRYKEQMFACLQTCNKTQVYILLYFLVLFHYQTTKFEWVKIVWDLLRWHWTSHLAQPHRMEQGIWYPLPQCLDLFMLLEHAWQMMNIISVHHQCINWSGFEWFVFSGARDDWIIRTRCWWWFGASPPPQLQPPAACNTCRTAVVELFGNNDLNLVGAMQEALLATTHWIFDDDSDYLKCIGKPPLQGSLHQDLFAMHKASEAEKAQRVPGRGSPKQVDLAH